VTALPPAALGSQDVTYKGRLNTLIKQIKDRNKARRGNKTIKVKERKEEINENRQENKTRSSM
jgi:hypothetical protein